jgi:serine protease AprX
MYRCDLAAVGNEVVSTQTPREALYYLGTTLQDDAQPTDPWYESLSGTSMSCPVTVGCCSLAAQAYRNEAGFFPKPLDLINIMEATAEGGSEAELAPHTEANAGAGFVDAVAAVELAQELGTAVAAQDDPSSGDPTEPEHPQLWEEIELCRFGQGQSLR